MNELDLISFYDIYAVNLLSLLLMLKCLAAAVRSLNIIPKGF